MRLFLIALCLTTPLLSQSQKSETPWDHFFQDSWHAEDAGEMETARDLSARAWEMVKKAGPGAAGFSLGVEEAMFTGSNGDVYSEALQMTVAPAFHVARLEILVRMGFRYSRQHEVRAERAYSEAVSLAEKMRPRPPYFGLVLADYATLEEEMGNNDVAETLLRRALNEPITELTPYPIFGTPGPPTGIRQIRNPALDLADLLEKEKRTAEAEEIYKRLDASTDLYERASALRAYWFFLLHGGRKREADETEKRIGDTLQAFFRQTDALITAGRLETASNRVDEELDLMRVNPPSPQPLIAQAESLRAKGGAETANRLDARITAMYKAPDPPIHLEVQDFVVEAERLVNAEKYDEAGEMIDKAFAKADGKRRMLERGIQLECLRNAARTFARKGRTTEAESILKRTFDLGVSFGEDRAWLLESAAGIYLRDLQAPLAAEKLVDEAETIIKVRDAADSPALLGIEDMRIQIARSNHDDAGVREHEANIRDLNIRIHGPNWKPHYIQ